MERELKIPYADAFDTWLHAAKEKKRLEMVKHQMRIVEEAFTTETKFPLKLWFHKKPQKEVTEALHRKGYSTEVEQDTRSLNYRYVVINRELSKPQ